MQLGINETVHSKQPPRRGCALVGLSERLVLPSGSLRSSKTIRAQINEPTELVGKLPSYLSGPFDGEKPVLKVTLTPKKSLSTSIEGIPVEVSFDHSWPWLDLIN